MNLTFLKTLKTNWIDCLLFVLLGLGIASLGGLIDYVITRYEGSSTAVALVLPTLSNYLQGFSRFVGAGVCASTVYIISWNSLNHFGNHMFDDAWNKLPDQNKLYIYVGAVGVALLAAAICFSAR